MGEGERAFFLRFSSFFSPDFVFNSFAASSVSRGTRQVAIERGQYRLRGASFGDSARRQWAACEALALPSGVWRRRGDCAYDNSVRVAYKRASNLAQRRVSNLRHVVWVAIAGSVAFFIATFALALSLSSLALPLPCFNPDIIRRKRRLIERPR